MLTDVKDPSLRPASRARLAIRPGRDTEVTGDSPRSVHIVIVRLFVIVGCEVELAVVMLLIDIIRLANRR
jgi:hypothetical protein